MARQYLPVGLPMASVWMYGYGVLAGAVRPDTEALKDTSAMYQLAEHRGDDSSLEAARFLYGLILARNEGLGRDQGLAILAEVRDSAWAHYITWFSQIAEIELAREAARAGDVDAAITMLDEVLKRDRAAGGTVLAGSAVESLVEALVQRRAAADLDAAQAAVDWLAAVPTEPGYVIFEIRFFVCVRCWHPRGATKRATGNTAIAIGVRRSRLSSRGMSRWPRRWPETGRLSRSPSPDSRTDR